jgi:hypothetical protein
MTTFVLISLVILTLVGIVTLLHALDHSVDGFEDEQGFHAANAPRLAVMATASVAFREDARLDELPRICTLRQSRHSSVESACAW